MEFLVLEVPQEHKDLLVHKVLKAHKVLRVQLVHKETEVLKELKVLKVRVESKGLRDFWDQRGTQGFLAPGVDKELKGL